MRDVSARGIVVRVMPRSRTAPAPRLALRALAGALAVSAVVAPLGAQRAAPSASAAANVGPHSAAAGVIAVRGTVSGEDVVRVARKQLGVRYRLGGTTPKAFDCSGFVRFVFAQYGIVLPRTAHEQAAVGIAPRPGDLAPGDLLFFYGGRGAQHIAMYVGGDTIIHASSSARRVRYDRLNGTHVRPSWFRRRLIAVRRVLPAQGTFYLPSATLSMPPSAAPEARLARSFSALPLVY
jgi:cell wall-associated NlpC family hydrolase